MLDNSETKRCRICNAVLTSANSLAKLIAHRDYICSTCKKKVAAAYVALHHEENITRAKNYYYDNQKDKINKSKKFNIKYKIGAMIKVSGDVRCVIPGCNCDDIWLLELHFKGGGHRKLKYQGKLPSGGVELYRDILFDRVPAELFEVMCKPHNSIAHLDKAVFSNFEIKYNRPLIKAAAA